MSRRRGYIRIETISSTCLDDICKTINHAVGPRLVNLCELIPGHAWGVSFEINIPSEAEDIRRGLVASLSKIKYTKFGKIPIKFTQTDMSFATPRDGRSDDSS